MENVVQKKTHSLCIKGETTVTGLTQVVSLEEKEVKLIVGERTLVLSGKDFFAEKLSVEDGVLVLKGEVEAVKYGSKSEPKSLLKRLFK